MAEIYALFSGRDGLVRYVGETGGTRQERFKQHQRSQIGRYISAVYEWIHSEWREGYPVRCVLLEWCKYEQRKQLEREWIARFPNLLNERKKPFFAVTARPPIIREVRNYMRRWKFNSGGYRGVHWCRDIDRYAVFFYVGGAPRWISGDETPGESAAIWFTDRYQAVEARDRYRSHYRNREWLRDIKDDERE